MGINLDKIQGALDRFDPEKRKAAASSDNTVKLEEGENTIRIVPYKYDEEMPFREFHFHYRIDGKTFVCPEKHGDEKCPVCEFVKKAWSEFNKTNDEDWREIAKSMRSQTRVFIPIIIKDGPNKEQLYSSKNATARWWGVSASNSPRSTYNKVLVAAKIALKRNIDITDSQKGMDLIVQVEKAFNDWVYPVDISLDVTPTPLIDGTKKEIQDLIDSVENIDTMFPAGDVADMKAALDSHLSGGSKKSADSDNSVGTEKSFSKKSVQEDDEDLPFDDNPVVGSIKDLRGSIEDKFSSVLGG